MDIEEMINRTNLAQIQCFLQYGTDWLKDTSKDTYSERIRASEQRSVEFFETYFPDMEKCEKVTALFDKEIGVYKDVYFEIGLILGAKLGFELHGKAKELGFK